MLKSIALGLIMLGVCMGCATKTEINKKTQNLPTVGSEAWFSWVEEKVGTGDGQGHGPDYGSQEWCFVIEKKLFANNSGLTPCTAQWNQKVTSILQEKAQ